MSVSVVHAVRHPFKRWDEEPECDAPKNEPTTREIAGITCPACFASWAHRGVGDLATAANHRNKVAESIWSLLYPDTPPKQWTNLLPFDPGKVTI